MINGIKNHLFQNKLLKLQIQQILGLKFLILSLLKAMNGINKQRQQLLLYLEVNGEQQLILPLLRLSPMLGEPIQLLLQQQVMNGAKILSKLRLVPGARSHKVKKKKKL